MMVPDEGAADEPSVHPRGGERDIPRVVAGIGRAGALRTTIARDAGFLALSLAAMALLVFLFHGPLGITSPTTAALGLLLVVLGAATVSTLWVASVASVVAVLAFNYFFLPPVGTFAIADPHNWIALIAFLAVAVIASQLSAAAKDRTRDAVARRLEVSRLFDLSRDILLTTESDGALPVLAQHVARRFELETVAICVPTDTGWALYQGGERGVEPTTDQLDKAMAQLRGTLEFDARRRMYGGQIEVSLANGRAARLVPLRLGTRPIGLLATDAGGLDPGVLDALGGVVAIAIERAHFLTEREAAATLKQRADLAATLLASLSHDLRTPLTAIRVAVANLDEPALGADERRSQSHLALQEIDRLNRLFQDILDMARIDAAAITPERQWVTPADLIDAAIQYAGTVVSKRTLQIEADGDTEIEIDPRLTSGALAHLLENAAHYSPREAPIEIRGWVAAAGLQLTVRDRGPGLDPAELDHLFEPFFRGDSARRHTSGTGMGLAITRGLLAAEGGRVWGENAAGGGTCFTIAVPSRSRAVTVGGA
jgi:two-component system sensor histidine kinase KdpD